MTNHNQHWSEKIADQVIERFPNNDTYTCAAGISPSGVVHFGNFRDVATAYAVAEALKKKGKKVRLIFSWDDYDRLRKVPHGIDPSFEEYIGTSLSAIPSPDENYSSYAEKFEKKFEKAMEAVGIELDYRYQTKEYNSGRYDNLIIHALQKRKELADILLSFMSEKGKANKNIDPEKYKNEYYPISVYSQFTGKDNTKVIDYDGNSTITYKCFDSGKTETIDIRKKRIVKLPWKVDWAMRWKEEEVNFEPGGADHAAPGGSYDVSKNIAKDIFDITPPLFQEYLFVGIQGLGSKMSGSKGNVISPDDLLEIYTPELLKWTYFRRIPNQTFELSFGSEIYKQYSEFDNDILKLNEGTLENSGKFALNLSGVYQEDRLPNIPFRQAVAFGQIVQWDKNKLSHILKGMELNYDPKSINERIEKAKNWLEKYNNDQVIRILDQINFVYVNQMNPEQKEQVNSLMESLKEKEDLSIKELDTIVYAIPKKEELSIKENAPLQRAFFKDVYNLLIGKDTGPRLSTFLWAADRKKVINLLDIKKGS